MEKKTTYTNFQELYSWEDIKMTSWIWRDSISDHCGYFPIALRGKDQVEKLGNNRMVGKYEMGNTHQTTYTLKYYYALQVLYATIGIACKAHIHSPYYYSAPHWVERNDSFMKLEESKYSGEENRKHFWMLLEELADSGEIKVSEGYFLRNITKGCYGDQEKLYCHTVSELELIIIIDTDSPKYIQNKMDDFQQGKYSREVKTYKWSDIKGYFVELTLPQIEILNHDWMHKYNDKDLELFRACTALDYERVKHAIEMGANVNALSPDGNSALQHAIQFFYDHGIRMDRQYTEEELAEIKEINYHKCIKIVDYLLDNGADINLFGYDGLAPIVEAYYAKSYDMIKHLLEKGANPNVNCYLTDTSDPDTISTLLELLCDSYDEEYYEEEYKIEQLVLSYGGIQRRQSDSQ